MSCYSEQGCRSCAAFTRLQHHQHLHAGVSLTFMQGSKLLLGYVFKCRCNAVPAVQVCHVMMSRAERGQTFFAANFFAAIQSLLRVPILTRRAEEIPTNCSTSSNAFACGHKTTFVSCHGVKHLVYRMHMNGDIH
jgi:hypothetical protein